METIKLSGINRDPRSQDQGSCQELINLRFRDGSWVPVGRKSTIKAADGITPAAGLPNMSVIFIHTVDVDTDQGGSEPHGKNYLGYNSTTGRIVTWEPTTPGSPTTLVEIGGGKDISFSAIKNLITIINKTDKKLSYLLWKDSAYSFLANRYPELPEFYLEIEGVEYTGNHQKVNDDSFRAVYNEKLSQWRKRGFDEGSAIIRLAYELFDGSIVGHSAPVLVNLVRWDKDVLVFENPQSTYPIDDSLKSNILRIKPSTPGNFRIWMYGGKPTLTYRSTPEGDAIIASLKNDYKHIVKNISVYMSKPVPSTDVNLLAAGHWWEVPSTGTPYKNVINQEIFYKIHTISPQDIIAGQKIVTIPGDLNSWESREVMPQDDFTHHTISGAAKLVYNGRLILGNITSKLTNGFRVSELLRPRVFAISHPEYEEDGDGDGYPDGIGEPYSFIEDPETISPYYIDIYTTILTEEGVKRVKISSPSAYNNAKLICNAVVAYPDTRASKMEIVKRTDAGSILIASYNLEKNPSHNLAQCMVQQNYCERIFLDFNPSVSVPYIIPDLRNNSYSDNNVVKMSALNNPMQFPSKNTYAVGLSKIIGFETNAIPISQGQFGQFPILVFTDGGMWAMELGGGGTTIATVVPLNDLVCNNPGTITKAEKSIIFSTTEGLMILQGSEGVLLSQQLRGEFNSPLLYNPEAELYTNYTYGSELVNLGSAISQVGFSEFLLHAKIGYDSKHRELIVSNTDNGGYPYSYVYSFANQTWTKISEKFKHFISDFPSFYAVRGDDRMVDLTTEESSAVDTLIMTRPIDHMELIKMIRLGSRASIDAESNKITGLYLFGSVDGRNWTLISGIQAQGTFNNPYVNRALMTFRHSIILMAGNYKTSTYINEINLELKYKYPNKTIR